MDVGAGGDVVVSNLTNPNGEDTSTIVYAIGSAEDGTLDLLVQSISGLHSSPNRVDSGTGGAAALGVDAEIGGVGVLADGSLEIPDDVDRLGWYRFGSAPDDGAGATVVTGHVDSRAQGAGAFFELHGVEPGARVEVDLSHGRTVVYAVAGRKRIDKDALPTDEVFRRSGPPVLVLVTCGGGSDSSDSSERSYADNVVVVAEPIS